MIFPPPISAYLSIIIKPPSLGTKAYFYGFKQSKQKIKQKTKVVGALKAKGKTLREMRPQDQDGPLLLLLRQVQGPVVVSAIR